MSNQYQVITLLNPPNEQWLAEAMFLKLRHTVRSGEIGASTAHILNLLVLKPEYPGQTVLQTFMKGGLQHFHNEAFSMQLYCAIPRK